MPGSCTPQIGTVVSAAFGENAYVVSAESSGTAAVIDPGLEPGAILQYVLDHSLGVDAILNTHGHADHIAGNALVKERFPDARLCIHEADAPMLADPILNLSGPFGISLTSPPADRFLRDGDSIDAAGLRFDVVHMPGHSPGHVVFVLPGHPTIVFDGDVLFADSIGRSDFPGGDHDLLIAGIRHKLLSLPPDTQVYPGHGPPTTVGREARTNPFVSGS